jgi:hypothetical protein
MINGAHVLLYSTNADADRALLKDILGLPHVDVGGGWLILGLPPAEIAVHPGEKNDQHEMYLMCENVEVFIERLRAKGIECAAVADQRWGRVTSFQLPGGGKLNAYEPRHARPPVMGKAGGGAPRKTRSAASRVRPKVSAKARSGSKKAATRTKTAKASRTRKKPARRR